MTERKGFNCLKSYYEVYLLLETNDDKADFMDNIFAKQFKGLEPTFEGSSPMSKMAYVSQKHSLDKSVKGFEDKTGAKLNTFEATSEANLIPLEHCFDANSIPFEGTLEAKSITPLDPCQQVQEEVQEKEKEEVQEKVKVKVKGKVKSLVPKTEKVFEEKILETYNSCLNYFEPHLHPKNPESWLETIEELNRIDKVPLDKIIEITKKAREDDFTRKNVFHALTKLRTKKDGLHYITIFNEKFKNTQGSQSVREIGQRAMESEIGKNFRV